MNPLFNRLYFSTLLFFLLSSLVCNAQKIRKNDVIRLRDNTKLEVVVKEVRENEITYKKISDVDGPLFSLNRSKIAFIEYGNGEVQNFDVVIEVQDSSRFQKISPPVRSQAPLPRNKFEEDVQKASSEKLQRFYKYHKSRSKDGMIMGVAGVAIGTIVAGIGTGMVLNSANSNPYYINYQDPQKASRGAWMIIGGFAGATTFGIAGFVKGAKNGSKASRIKRELNLRGESLTFNISPGFNATNKSGYLTLSMIF